MIDLGTVTHRGHTGKLIRSNLMRGFVCSICGRLDGLFTDEHLRAVTCKTKAQRSASSPRRKSTAPKAG